MFSDFVPDENLIFPKPLILTFNLPSIFQATHFVNPQGWIILYYSLPHDGKQSETPGFPLLAAFRWGEGAPHLAYNCLEEV